MVRRSTAMARLGTVLLSLTFVASALLVSYGVGLIYAPAGFIAAGVGCAVLGWLFAVEVDE